MIDRATLADDEQVMKDSSERANEILDQNQDNYSGREAAEEVSALCEIIQRLIEAVRPHVKE